MDAHGVTKHVNLLAFRVGFLLLFLSALGFVFVFFGGFVEVEVA